MDSFAAIESEYLGIRWTVDNNFFPISRSPERAELLALRQAGCIRLARTDVLSTELLNATSGIADRLRFEAGPLSEYLGPLVPDHSRVGFAVLGSSADQSLLDQVTVLLFPGKDSRPATPHEVRDAMHIAWSIRYGFDGFITDDRRLLGKDSAFRERFNFSILSPAAALVVARRFQKKAELRRRRKGLVS
jgi:hypothetical protein